MHDAAGIAALVGAASAAVGAMAGVAAAAYRAARRSGMEDASVPAQVVAGAGDVVTLLRNELVRMSAAIDELHGRAASLEEEVHRLERLVDVLERQRDEAIALAVLWESRAREQGWTAMGTADDEGRDVG